MVYGTFSPAHSQVVAPTAHGNLIAGLGYFTEPADKTDSRVEPGKMAEVMKMSRELIPSLSEKDIITSFAGIKSENNKVDNGDLYIAPIQYNADTDRWVNYHEHDYLKRPWLLKCGGCHATGVKMKKKT